MIDMYESQSKTIQRREKILLQEKDRMIQERKNLLDSINSGSDEIRRVRQERKILHDEPIENLNTLLESKKMELEQLNRDFRDAASREDRKIAQVDRSHVENELKVLRHDLKIRLERRHQVTRTSTCLRNLVAWWQDDWRARVRG